MSHLAWLEKRVKSNLEADRLTRSELLDKPSMSTLAAATDCKKKDEWTNTKDSNSGVVPCRAL